MNGVVAGVSPPGGAAAAADPDRRRTWLIGGFAVAFVAFMLALEISSFRLGFRGPTRVLLGEFVFGPKRGRVMWAGLALAIVGLDRRQKLTCLGVALAIDVAFVVGRLPFGSRLTFGNGVLYVLVGLTALAATRWEGEQRLDAYRGVVMGGMLIVASKIADAWLRITALTRPQVLDEYVQTADRALGNPSWLVGQLVEATGQVGHLVLQTIYIELPVAAIVVAVFQLRKGWPSHHLFRTFLVIGMVGPLFYLLFPVVGPIFAYGNAGRGWAVGDMWPRLSSVDLTPVAIEFDRLTPRNCMPSLHTAWVTAIFVHTRRGPGWLRAFGSVWLVGTLLATLGFGYHYGVDLVAGVVFALTVEAGLRDPERGWGWWRWRLVGGGSAVLAVLLLSYRYLSVPMAEFPVLSGPGLLALLGGCIVAFHATFFARPGTALARWGRRDQDQDQDEELEAPAQAAVAT